MMIQEREDLRLEKPLREIWKQAVELISRQVTTATLETWIRPMRLVEITDSTVRLAVSNEFQRKWILDYHLATISKVMQEVLRRPVEVRLAVETSDVNQTYTPSIAAITVIPEPAASGGDATNAPQQPRQLEAAPRAGLNPKYSFESFVVGTHNRFCHSAAMAVAERPGQAYNPLFLYGGVGLGKTHIMHAIGQRVLQHSPGLSVRYISCERFTNELINSIRDEKMIEFRKRYRQVDVLLIDDIQFIEGKESTQMEIFHTFNALRDSGRQIVLSSDRPPSALSLLEERLRSRFEWGLIADIQSPDLETRTAILRKKAQIENMRVPDDVLGFIASLYTSNIRELEGALIRVHAYASLTGAQLTLQSAASILQPAGPARLKAPVTMDSIIQAVACHYKLEASELRSSKRSQDLALPRHIAMYLAHELIQISFPRIGEAFGGRKHTSAIYAHKRIKEDLQQSADLASAVEQITRQLGF